MGIRRVIVGALVAAGMAAPAAHASDPIATLGVYRGAAAPGEIAAFDAWRGGPPSTYALDFIVANDWNPIRFPYFWANAWRDSRYRVVYSVPMLPSNGATLARGATGAYDSYFGDMASNLVAAGQGDAILRIGWEFNGDWYPWAASRDPQAFVTYWRHIVDAIRAVPGAHFTFDWAANEGRGAIAPDTVYPGDAYVDVIGLDVHDQDWSPAYQDPVGRWSSLVNQPYGLAWQKAFAAEHGKPLSFPEWGLTERDDGHGGGDDPYYVEHMHDWIAANNVLYHAYFEYDGVDGRHRLMTGQFPLGAAVFKRLFGGPPPPPPVVPPAPTPTPPPVKTPVATATPTPPRTASRPRTTAPAPAREGLVTSQPADSPPNVAVGRSSGSRVRVLKVRASRRTVRIAGRVRAARHGRVRVELRTRNRVRARIAAVHADGRFATAIRRPAPGTFRIVTRYDAGWIRGAR